MIPPAPLGADAAVGLHGLGAATEAVPETTSERTAAERRFRFELAAHPGSPAQARRLTRARLSGWSVCEDTCDTAALVVSELVTNAVVHTASTRIVCEVQDGGKLLRIAVRDEGCATGEPQSSLRLPEEEHGRGLLLVDAVCHAWGVHEHGPGLLVWAELARGGDDSDDGGGSGADAGPRADLGWGTRPKQDPAGGDADTDDDGTSDSGDGLGPTQAHHAADAAPGAVPHDRGAVPHGRGVGREDRGRGGALSAPRVPHRTELGTGAVWL
ncbi:ATP-binding protein [Streptomyces echinoruber]|uniref:ATPase n=1 Tax=Streptomyces echinoruber TaxID=68898 RepID=A0A918QV70_9ACTN|nr:ATPase [Streptomyces echinoruber]